MECDDEEKEYFPTASLDDEVWLEEPLQERDICIHMAPRKPETNYTSWTTTYPQEYIPNRTAAYPQEYIPEQTAAYLQEYIPEQTAAYPQEYIPEQAAANPQEYASKAITWNEYLNDFLTNMPDIVDDPDEELI